MIFSSSSTSSSAYGPQSKAAPAPCPCSVRPCPILPLLIPHKGSSFKLLWEGGGNEGARARGMRDGVPVAKGRAGSTEERGTRDGAWARITMATGLKFDP